ncbi:MAG: fatty acid CoA ligase family protein [Thermodesulfobacteriota bacterium]
MTDDTVNIGATLPTQARLQPTNTALVEAATGRSLTFEELNRLADGYAHTLTEGGVRAGERVMLMVRPGGDFIALTYGLFKIGAPVILIDPGMGYKNLLRCIASVAPEVLIGIPKACFFKKLFSKPFATVRRSFCCGFSMGLFGADIRTAARKNSKVFDSYPASSEELAAIIFTTGSTGPPKGVRYPHRVFQAQLRLIRDYYKIGPDEVDQPGFPLFALFSTGLGAKAVIPDMDPTRPAQVDPVRFIKSIEHYGVTYSFGSPAIWKVIVDHCHAHGLKLDGLTRVLMAGAPVSGELISRMQEILPEEAEIHTPYGATESLPVVSIEGREIVEETWEHTCTGHGTCVGRPLPGIEVKIIDSSDEPVAEIDMATFSDVGKVGEIIVRGDVVTRAYDNNDKENRLAKIRDGEGFWHRIGDLGYMDEQGRVWFCGRKTHRVETEDSVLYTICCEAIVNVHPDISRSALVGIPGRGSKMIPVIIVEPQPDFQDDEGLLLAEVREIARVSQLTASIQHFLIHPSFPVDIRHNAKIFREKLAVWAKDELGDTL